MRVVRTCLSYNPVCLQPKMINRAYNASCEIEFSDVTNFTQIRGLLVKVNYPNFDKRNSFNQVSALWELIAKKGRDKRDRPLCRSILADF